MQVLFPFTSKTEKVSRQKQSGDGSMKKLKICSSNYLHIGVIIMLLIFWIILPVSFGYGLFLSIYDKSGVITFSFFIFASFFCGILCLISEVNQWLDKFIITEDGITIKCFLKKSRLLNYSDYNRINFGYMLVNGIPEWFIIISNRKMSRFELENLNKIKQTDDFIKIKYSKKRREKLMEILPQNMACQLKNPPPGKK